MRLPLRAALWFMALGTCILFGVWWGYNLNKSAVDGCLQELRLTLKTVGDYAAENLKKKGQ